MTLPVLLLAGCGGGVPKGPPVRAGCEEATGQGVAQGRASARLIAQASLNQSVHELRGFMIKDGYHGVRPGAARVDCFGYALGLGLTQCVARVPLCAH